MGEYEPWCTSSITTELPATAQSMSFSALREPECGKGKFCMDIRDTKNLEVSTLTVLRPNLNTRKIPQKH